MTKAELIALVIDNLVGGNEAVEQRSKYHPETTAKYIELAINNMLGDLCMLALKTKDYSFLDDYTKAFEDVPVDFAANRNEYYSWLPSPVLDLPNNHAIRQISRMLDQKNVFNYTDYASQNVFGIMDDYAPIVTSVSYYVEGEKVFYQRLNNPCKVLMKLVIPFSAFKDDENLPAPYSKSTDIFNAVRQLMGIKMSEMEDKKNDSTNIVQGQQQ